MGLPRTTNGMCYCIAQTHSPKFSKPVAAWTCRRGLLNTSSALAFVQHDRGSSTWRTPTTSPYGIRPPANGVVFVLQNPKIPAKAHNRGKPAPAAHLCGCVSTMANTATSRTTAEHCNPRYILKYTSPLHQPTRNVPVALHADVTEVIYGVDVTDSDEPVTRKPLSGNGWR